MSDVHSTGRRSSIGDARSTAADVHGAEGAAGPVGGARRMSAWGTVGRVLLGTLTLGLSELGFWLWRRAARSEHPPTGAAAQALSPLDRSVAAAGLASTAPGRQNLETVVLQAGARVLEDYRARGVQAPLAKINDLNRNPSVFAGTVRSALARLDAEFESGARTGDFVAAATATAIGAVQHEMMRKLEDPAPPLGVAQQVPDEPIQRSTMPHAAIVEEPQVEAEAEVAGPVDPLTEIVLDRADGRAPASRVRDYLKSRLDVFVEEAMDAIPPKRGESSDQRRILALAQVVSNLAALNSQIPQEQERSLLPTARAFGALRDRFGMTWENPNMSGTEFRAAAYDIASMRDEEIADDTLAHLAALVFEADRRRSVQVA